jgi:hypothetical protein
VRASPAIAFVRVVVDDYSADDARRGAWLILKLDERLADDVLVGGIKAYLSDGLVEQEAGRRPCSIESEPDRSTLPSTVGSIVTDALRGYARSARNTY